MPLLKSWVDSANRATTEFPLNNLPYGVFSTSDKRKRCGIAIGDYVLDTNALEKTGLISAESLGADCELICSQGRWNTLMAQPPEVWAAFRTRIHVLLAESSAERKDVEPCLHALTDVTLHLPFEVAEFTDFYSCRHHAINVGTMFRGAENALPPNWLHIPIGYNGRASSMVVSGTDIRRPWGQLKSPEYDNPAFMPSKRFDLELEMGAIVGNTSSGPVSVDQADEMIFGYVLLNDWSARDIQAWEYQPLGPFQAKATATTLSPWIISKAALEPFRVSTPEREHELLSHLKDTTPMLYDIHLSVSLKPDGKPASTIARTNYSQLYYSAAQQLAHHSSSGCPMRTGDVLGSGTISGPEKDQRGSLLELSWGGKEPLQLDNGVTRSFLEDGDTLTLNGNAQGDGYIIGFGDCTGTVLPALEDPYGSATP